MGQDQDNVFQVITGEEGSKRMKCERSERRKNVRGTVVLVKNKFLGFDDPKAAVLDWLDELIGRKVSLQLIGSVNGDPGCPSYLEKWNGGSEASKASETNFAINFDCDEEMGVPGALLIRNNHHSEFYLKTVTLEDVPDHGRVHFVCNSWVYPTEHYKTDRVFFSNKTYLPHEMPAPLCKYREEELLNLRGDGKGELKEADRVYDYACYNDLGDPDRDKKYARPILGGCTEYPYPRRQRTGRAPSKSDRKTESRLSPLKSLSIYVPRDEQFSPLKKTDFIFSSLLAIAQLVGPELEALLGKEFNSHDEVLALCEGNSTHSNGPLISYCSNNNPLENLNIREMFRFDGESPFKFPIPQVIKEDKSAWMTDEEFAREMLAGLNPVNIHRLKEFPPVSKLNRRQYGEQNSSITKEHIENNLNGLSIDEAIEDHRLFILDHHDALMPYLNLINRETSTKIYASRTILFLKDDGTLKPLAIELSLPHPEGEQFGALSSVYTPAQRGIEGAIWKLAKAYVAVNDSGFHQLISHWLHTHAAIEPFIIATNRQLSVVHPIHKLLHPHFRDTLYINALGRQILINAGGVLEMTVFPGKYAMEMSSAVYKNWVFTDQALPKDLKNRGMAVEDETGFCLVIEDYPYAVDGLEIWSAIVTWVTDYCSFYYKTEAMVQDDSELQSWWKELREVGHGDSQLPEIQTCQELIETCTIIIWVASALHAAVNFGQYSYGGYLPNRPTISRRLMPEKGSEEYKQLESNPDRIFLETITAKPLAILGISLVEILSMHSSDEMYLGQREDPEWTSDAAPLRALEKFRKTLEGIEERITERNTNAKWKNRVGPVNVPYTLLIPSSEVGLTGKGIPNSISI